MESLNLNNSPSLQVGLRITLGQKNGIFSQMCVSNVISNQERILLCKATRTLIVVFGTAKLPLFSFDEVVKFLMKLFHVDG